MSPSRTNVAAPSCCTPSSTSSTSGRAGQRGWIASASITASSTPVDTGRCSTCSATTGRKVVRRCNDFLTEQLADHTVSGCTPLPSSISATSTARWSRLERAHGTGHSRVLPLHRGGPTSPGGCRPAHPPIGITHLGGGQQTSGWLRSSMWAIRHPTLTAGPTSAGTSPTVRASLRSPRLANTQRIPTPPRTCCPRCSTAGVFARHPETTVLLEEMRVGWVPNFLAMLSRQALAGRLLRSASGRGSFPAPRSAMHAVARLTPLPGFGDDRALDVPRAAPPDMCVFSSDYPHMEGNADPIELYRPRARRSIDLDLPHRVPRRDHGRKNYARMGDPLSA